MLKSASWERHQPEPREERCQVSEKEEIAFNPASNGPGSGSKLDGAVSWRVSTMLACSGFQAELLLTCRLPRLLTTTSALLN